MSQTQGSGDARTTEHGDVPSTRDLVRPIMMRRGAERTVRNVADWTGRPKAEVRAEIEAMEHEGLIEQLRKPGGERFWVPRES